MRGWFGAGTLGHAGGNSAGRWPARLVPKLERLEVDSRRLGTHRMALQKKQLASTKYQKFLRVGVWFARLQSWLSGISRDRRRCGMRGRGGGRRCESGCRAYCFAPRFSPQASAPSRASLPASSSARPLAGRDEKPRRPPAGVPPASSTAARKGGSAMRASPLKVCPEEGSAGVGWVGWGKGGFFFLSRV